MLNKRSIVIAESSPILRSVLTDIFREYGWRVRSREDGFASLQAIVEEAPTVLLSDLEMSGISGLQLLSIVRKHFPSIRTVAMSAALAGSGVPAGVAADAFYAKRASLATLLDIVAEIGSKRMDDKRRGEMPVWLSASFRHSASEALFSVACSSCVEAAYSGGQYGAPESQLVCPECRQQATVALLHDSPDVLNRELQANTLLVARASFVGSDTPAFAATS